MQESREALVQLIRAKLREKNIAPAVASKQIGKNHAYLQQFFSRNVPAALPEITRHKLASLIEVEESELRVASHKTDQSAKVIQDKMPPGAFNDPAAYASVPSHRETVPMGDVIGNEAVIKDLMIQMRDISTRMTRIEGAVFGVDPGVVPDKLGPPSRRKA